MTTHSIFAPPFVSSQSTFSLRRVSAKVWARVGAMLRARESRRQLTEMDDHLLADIGASRSDAVMEASRPFWDMR